MARTKQTARKSTGGPSGSGRRKQAAPSNITGVRKKRKQMWSKEIVRLQKSGELVCAKAPFARLVQKITRDVQLKMLQPNQSEPRELRYQVSAIGALHKASEAYLIGLMEDLNLITRHAGRVTLMPKDMDLVRHLRGDKLWYPGVEDMNGFNRRWALNNPDYAEMSVKDYTLFRKQKQRFGWAKAAKKKNERRRKKAMAVASGVRHDDGGLAVEVARPDSRVEEEAKKRFLIHIFKHKEVGMWRGGGKNVTMTRIDNWFAKHGGVDNICLLGLGCVLNAQELSVMVEDTGVDPNEIAPIGDLQMELGEAADSDERDVSDGEKEVERDTDAVEMGLIYEIIEEEMYDAVMEFGEIVEEERWMQNRRPRCAYPWF